MVDMSELTESVKGYIEGLQDVLQRKYQISEEKALNMITSSYIMDSLIDYPEETLHDDIEAHADNIYEDQVSKTERLLLEAGYEGTIFFTNPSYEDAFLGISSDDRAIYDYEKMVESLVNDDFLRPEMACSDFGMRGMSCMEEAVRCSSAWLLSFDKTSTIPAIDYIDTYYDACCLTKRIGIGAVSTEHSVMASNYAVDGDEITFVKRLLTELYPNASFSMVSDTYDYWNMIDNILPACKKEIMQHNGKLLVRPDSGDMVEIAVETIEKLWNTFGGTVNSKGYKVLDPHIGIIYGDGCTLNNVKQVWEKLKKKGFAANNIVFGVGAFCFSAVIEPDGHMVVVTRDMFGIAMKATYGIVNGEPIMIYKDPKTDTSHLKKSHKGCCCIYYDDNGELQCEDGYNDVFRDGALSTVFVDGKACNKETFEDIRERLNGGNKDE